MISTYAALRALIRRRRCTVNGHLWVTHYRPASVQTVCYLCDATKGKGWTMPLRAPRPRVDVPKPAEWKPLIWKRRA